LAKAVRDFIDFMACGGNVRGGGAPLFFGFEASGRYFESMTRKRLNHLAAANPAITSLCHAESERQSRAIVFMTSIKHGEPNPLLLATPVCAQLSFLSQWPGAPEQDRSAATA